MIRLPLFWCNVAIVFGFFSGLALIQGNFSNFLAALCLGIGAFLLNPRKKIFQGALYGACGIIAASGYFIFFTKLSAQRLISPREVKVLLKVKKCFRSNDEQSSGLAEVEATEGKHLSWLVGKTLFVRLPKSKHSQTEQGDVYLTKGVLSMAVLPLNQKQANFQNFLLSNHIFYQLKRIRYVEKIETKPSLVEKLQKQFTSMLSHGMSNKEASQVYQAILLGKKEFLGEQTFQNFLYTGTLHLFAVSGLHVGVVGSFLLACLRIFPIPRLLKLALMLLGIFIYVSVVGFSPSTVRAFIMISGWCLVQWIQRQPRVEDAFLSSVFGVLLFNPWQLWDIGFQLSYGIVGSILWVGIPAGELTKQFFANFHRFIPQNELSLLQRLCSQCAQRLSYAFAVSISASIFSSLLVSYYWGLFSPWAFLVNVILIPLASLIVILGSTALSVGLLNNFLLNWINQAANYLLEFLLWLVEKLNLLPWACLNLKISTNLFISLSSACFFLVVGLAYKRHFDKTSLFISTQSK